MKILFSEVPAHIEDAAQFPYVNMMPLSALHEKRRQRILRQHNYFGLLKFEQSENWDFSLNKLQTKAQKRQQVKRKNIFQRCSFCTAKHVPYKLYRLCPSFVLEMGCPSKPYMLTMVNSIPFLHKLLLSFAVPTYICVLRTSFACHRSVSCLHLTQHQRPYYVFCCQPNEHVIVNRSLTSVV